MIVGNDDRKIKLRKIVIENGLYFGVIKVKHKKIKVPIEQREIKSYHLLNRPMTALGNAGFVTLGIVAIVTAIFASDQWDDSRGSDVIINGRP